MHSINYIFLFLVTVDNVGTVRLWETGVDNLSKSLADWRIMVGEDKGRLRIIQQNINKNLQINP